MILFSATWNNNTAPDAGIIYNTRITEMLQMRFYSGKNTDCWQQSKHLHFYHENSMFLQNICNHLQYYTVSQPRRP
jgi:hypothetical protein